MTVSFMHKNKFTIVTLQIRVRIFLSSIRCKKFFYQQEFTNKNKGKVKHRKIKEMLKNYNNNLLLQFF
jgi:hypothetical protein